MSPTLTYAESLDALSRALKFGINPSLEGIRVLCEQLRRPQDAVRFVQVAGTNGKTSVARMTAALLGADGTKTACYTSPHLVSYRERIVIAGEPVSEADFALGLSAALQAAEEVGREYTEFELLTAAALWLMRERGVEWGVLEVGLGGRWDATTLVDPEVAVLTGVALDHTDRLGETVEKIAADKAQIIKPGVTVVAGPGTAGIDDILHARVDAVGAHELLHVRDRTHPRDRGNEQADVWYAVVERPKSPVGRLVLDVAGRFGDYARLALAAPSYQAPNIAVALAATEAARGAALDPDEVRASLAAMCFPGRFEVVGHDPWLILDGAHNPEAATVLGSAIQESFGEAKPTAVIGMLADKDAEAFVSALAPHVERFVCTRNTSYRSRTPEDLAGIVRSVTGLEPEVRDELMEAIRFARAATSTGVVVTGSLYTAGEARALLGLR